MIGLLIWVFTADIPLTFCCETCEVSTLVGITLHYICIIPMLTLNRLLFFFFFFLLNITFVRLQGNTSFE